MDVCFGHGVIRFGGVFKRGLIMEWKHHWSRTISLVTSSGHVVYSQLCEVCGHTKTWVEPKYCGGCNECSQKE
jgi:hypothetical protein